ncbi:exosortase-associated EpsI family protein [Kordiimonas sp. SCSIO 12610]|uniref:exosortase-associated EpsI family protein n=1 Tax=Kordiimonas sp. SCSIO 12610 TaxID=2829597 RepID=UPI00210D3B23|nr:exosortase-associated EpsI family protein [Kordiimonas sp. SCSIO 12610]UTW54148.1 exosortase-associated EpsI family protein [Kordiimonas sp. SCSIO 12610]
MPIAYRFSDIDLRAQKTGRENVGNLPDDQKKQGFAYLVIIFVFLPIVSGLYTSKVDEAPKAEIQLSSLICDDCGYRQLENSTITYVPKFFELDDMQSATLRRGADFIFAFKGGYSDQSGSKSLLGYYDTYLVDGWQLIPSNNEVKHQIGDVQYDEKTLWRGDERLLVFYSYEIGGKWPGNSDWQVKLYSAIARLGIGKAPASVIVAATKIDDNTEYARSVLTRYLAEVNIDHAEGAF